MSGFTDYMRGVSGMQFDPPADDTRQNLDDIMGDGYVSVAPPAVNGVQTLNYFRVPRDQVASYIARGYTLLDQPSSSGLQPQRVEMQRPGGVPSSPSNAVHALPHPRPMPGGSPWQPQAAPSGWRPMPNTPDWMPQPGGPSFPPGWDVRPLQASQSHPAQSLTQQLQQSPQFTQWLSQMRGAATQTAQPAEAPYQVPGTPEFEVNVKNIMDWDDSQYGGFLPPDLRAFLEDFLFRPALRNRWDPRQIRQAVDTARRLMPDMRTR